MLIRIDEMDVKRRVGASIGRTAPTSEVGQPVGGWARPLGRDPSDARFLQSPESAFARTDTTPSISPGRRAEL